MEALDATRRQSFCLPSLSQLDADRSKREAADAQRKHSMASLLHPFSNHQSSPASAGPGPLGGLLSPPESRRTSDDNNEQQRAPVRQSLPSIHEALARPDLPVAFSAPPPLAPPSAPQSATQSYFPRPPTTSPTDHRARAFSTDFRATQGTGNPFSRPPSPFLSASASTAPPPPPAQTQSSGPDSLPRASVSEARPSYPELRPSFPSPRPSFSAPAPAPQHNPRLPTLHPLRTNQSPPPGPSQSNVPHSSYPPQQSPAHDSSGPQSAGPMNPNYGYSQHPSNYPLSAPAPGVQSSQYPPSAATYSAPARPFPPPPTWPDDLPAEEKISRFTLAGYGESIKRQLESFDLEASLNEMVDGAGRIIEFSKEYRQRTQYQRIGVTPQSMPPLEEVQGMLQHSDRIQVSLQRMRDVIFNHQRQSMVAEPPPEIRYPGTNGVEYEARADYVEDGKGFVVPDMKKIRRGRAAPPGRCHSCNRAETPEWRRGPDGARTLCNACGLHYAKLTRKMGGKNAMTGSNLRPKSLDQGSSTA